jgi:hypothetical protein
MNDLHRLFTTHPGSRARPVPIELFEKRAANAESHKVYGQGAGGQGQR